MIRQYCSALEGSMISVMLPFRFRCHTDITMADIHINSQKRYERAQATTRRGSDLGSSLR